MFPRTKYPGLDIFFVKFWRAKRGATTRGSAFRAGAERDNTAAKRLNILLGLLAAAGLASAQVASRAVDSPETLGKILQVSRSELLVLAPSLREKRVAEALHSAATQRGAKVFVLVDDRWVSEPASFIGGLSLTRNVQVRLMRGLKDAWAVMDRRVLIEGPMLVDEVNPLEALKTTVSEDRAAVSRYVRWFASAWPRARPYRYALTRN